MNAVITDMYRKMDILKLIESRLSNLNLSSGHYARFYTLLFRITWMFAADGFNHSSCNPFQRNRVEQEQYFLRNTLDEVLNQINKWTFQNKRHNVLTSNYAVTVTDDSGKTIEEDVQMKLITLGDDQSAFSKTLGLVNEDENNFIIVPTSFHQTRYTF